MSESEASNEALVSGEANALLERRLGEIVAEMQRMNAGTVTVAAKDKQDRPIAAVVLVADDDRDDNQAVLNAIEAVTDPDDLNEEQ